MAWRLAVANTGQLHFRHTLFWTIQFSRETLERENVLSDASLGAQPRVSRISRRSCFLSFG
eukprot:643800-Prymnesium_polylepis.1